MNIEARINWALSFVKMDLAALRLGDRLNVISNLHEFFSGDDCAVPFVQSENLPSVESKHTIDGSETWKKIGLLQSKLNRLVSNLIISNETRYLSITNMRLKSDSENLFLLAPWPDAVLVLLSQCLWIEWNRVKACKECGEIFLSIRRQLYCNRKCTNRATVRDWRRK